MAKRGGGWEGGDRERERAVDGGAVKFDYSSISPWSSSFSPEKNGQKEVEHTKEQMKPFFLLVVSFRLPQRNIEDNVSLCTTANQLHGPFLIDSCL